MRFLWFDFIVTYSLFVFKSQLDLSQKLVINLS